MARVDDLLDLIQTTNEVYFITAPGRVRTAYILVDDISELALKTYLQEQTLNRRKACETYLERQSWIQSQNHRTSLRRYYEGAITIQDLCQSLGRSGANDVSLLQGMMAPYEPLQHWSANDPNVRKTFDDIIDEVKALQPTGSPSMDLLDTILARHKQRNKFFHDHHQSGLTVDDEKCLRAICDLYSLMETLFPDFNALVQEQKVVRCQIGVLRLKLAAIGSNDISDVYSKTLEEFGTNHTLNRWSLNFEHSILHTVSERFFMALRTQFNGSLAELETRITVINNMSRRNTKHRRELEDKTQHASVLRSQLAALDLLFGTP